MWPSPAGFATRKKTTYMLNDIVGHGKFIIIIWDELGVPVVLIGT
jgi:hypothetical protein